MNLTRCPICHARIHLDALVQDAAGRELMALLAKLDTQTGTALVSYLSLFRSSTRDLSHERALRLANETLLLADPERLSIALADTCEALRSKQSRQVLKNHNYLKRVLESIEAQPVVIAPQQQTITPTSKTGKSLAALEQLKHG